MKKSSFPLVLFGLVALFLCGCASNNYESGTQLSPDKISQIKKGVTTRTEVEALFGPPENVSLAGDGKRIMSYRYTSNKVEGHATASAFIPFVGPFLQGSAGQAQMHMQMLQVILDPSNVVLDYEFNDNTRNTTMSSNAFSGTTTSSEANNAAPTSTAPDHDAK